MSSVVVVLVSGLFLCSPVVIIVVIVVVVTVFVSPSLFRRPRRHRTCRRHRCRDRRLRGAVVVVVSSSPIRRCPSPSRSHLVYPTQPNPNPIQIQPNPIRVKLMVPPLLPRSGRCLDRLAHPPRLALRSPWPMGGSGGLSLGVPFGFGH